jgi:hypothetical protein
VDWRWEELPEGDDRPRRCYYRLNPDGIATARTLLAERRPEALQRLGRPIGSPLPKPGIATALTRFAGLAGGLG